MGAAVVRVTGQLAQGVIVMRNNDVGSERADLVDQGGDHLVQRCVDEPGAAWGRLWVAGVAVPEHVRCARAECTQRVGELGCPRALRRPRHRDDSSARVRGSVLGEYAAGEEAFIVRMGKHTEQG